MKELSKLICLLSVLTFIGCSKKEKDFEYTKVVSELELLRMQQMQRSTNLPQGEFNPNADGLPIGEELNPLVDGFCKMISDKNLENPFSVDKYFSSQIKMDDYNQYITIIRGLEEKCVGSKVLLDKYPLLFVEYSLESGRKVYGNFRVGEDRKVTSFLPFLNDGIEFTHKLIEMSDGEKISTTIVKNSSGPTRTIYLKTPYFHTDNMVYYVYDALNWATGGYSFVIQSNRGSHASTGNFKWLHEKNVQDSKETIDWISKQKFNNGEVTSYGTSYDGYNALAASVGKPKALKSVIACSAPANAQTDSFTAGETIEAWLINYIANRENPKAIGRFTEKVHYLETNKIPYEQYDNYLYGRDLADWEDLMAAKKSGSLESYWATRSLLKGLKDVTIPVFHIAGTRSDQDGRDTVLTYRYIEKHAEDPTNHRLYIHRYGHGCGNFLQEQIGTDFLDHDFAQMKQEYRDSAIDDSIIGDLNEQIEVKQLALEVSSNSPTGENIAKINNRFDIASDKLAYLTYNVLEDIQINGVPEIELMVRSSLVKSNLVINLYYTENGSPQSAHGMVWGSSRSSFVLNEVLEGEHFIKLTLPPMAFKVSKGESITIILSAEGEDFLDIFKEQRKEYYTRDEKAGYIEILGENGVLTLPIEKSLKPSLDTLDTPEEVNVVEEVEAREEERVVEEVHTDEEVTSSDEVVSTKSSRVSDSTSTDEIIVKPASKF